MTKLDESLLVEPEAAVPADPVEPQVYRGTKRRSWLLVVAALVVLAVGVLLGVMR